MNVYVESGVLKLAVNDTHLDFIVSFENFFSMNKAELIAKLSDIEWEDFEVKKDRSEYHQRQIWVVAEPDRTQWNDSLTERK